MYQIEYVSWLTIHLFLSLVFAQCFLNYVMLNNPKETFLGFSNPGLSARRINIISAAISLMALWAKLLQRPSLASNNPIMKVAYNFSMIFFSVYFKPTKCKSCHVDI